MIALITKAITSKLAGPIALGLAIVLLTGLVWQSSQLSLTRGELAKADERIETLGRDLSQCRVNIGTLEDAREVQNAALDAFKREGEAKAAEVAKARQASRQEAERADRAAAALRRLSPAGLDVCARMLEVDEAVKELAR